MADSNITKKALATALKELIPEIPFEKITIKNICDKCEMNRKSFYYHFTDKYDLANSIYHNEFIIPSKGKKYKDVFDFFEDILKYFEDNKLFYRRLIKCNGQNSFSNYFSDFLYPYLKEYTDKVFPKDENAEFYISIYTDTIVHTIKKWLSDPDAVPAEKFVCLIKKCIFTAAENFRR